MDGLFHGLVRQALGLAGGCPAGEAAQGKSQGKSNSLPKLSSRMPTSATATCGHVDIT